MTTRTGEVSLPSRTVRQELPVRVVLFLRAVSAHPAIRQALEAGGYSEADHAEGLRLLGRLCEWDAGGFDADADRPAREARGRCESFVVEHFPRLRAAVERLHPEDAPLFSFSRAAASDPVVTLGTWLERVDRLGHDAPVARTLARRGVGRAELDRRAEDVREAMTVRPPRKQAPRDRDADVAALHRWHRDWVATARTFVKRKDWLVILGVRARGRA